MVSVTTTTRATDVIVAHTYISSRCFWYLKYNSYNGVVIGIYLQLQYSSDTAYVIGTYNKSSYTVVFIAAATTKVIGTYYSSYRCYL
jgi:hypothetical protein